ncbi:MAG TPA: hypothetical protein VK673_04125 [Chthoniobacterales bacterium]|nr:hypothetical protein [Chthoniobacterales bacterium]
MQLVLAFTSVIASAGPALSRVNEAQAGYLSDLEGSCHKPIYEPGRF